MHRGRLVQRGQSVGSVLGAVGRYLVPWAIKTGKQLLRSKTVRKAGGKILKAGANTLAETVAGKNVGEALKKNVKRAKKDVSSTLKKSMQAKLTAAINAQPQSKRKKINTVKKGIRKKKAVKSLFQL